MQNLCEIQCSSKVYVPISFTVIKKHWITRICKVLSKRELFNFDEKGTPILPNPKIPWSNVSKKDQSNVLKIDETLIRCNINDFTKFHVNRYKVLLNMIIWILWLFLDRSARFIHWKKNLLNSLRFWSQINLPSVFGILMDIWKNNLIELLKVKSSSQIVIGMQNIG